MVVYLDFWDQFREDRPEGLGRVYGVGNANSSLRWAKIDGCNRHKVSGRGVDAPHEAFRPLACVVQCLFSVSFLTE